MMRAMTNWRLEYVKTFNSYTQAIEELRNTRHHHEGRARQRRSRSAPPAVRQPRRPAARPGLTPQLLLEAERDGRQQGRTAPNSAKDLTDAMRDERKAERDLTAALERMQMQLATLFAQSDVEQRVVTTQGEATTKAKTELTNYVHSLVIAHDDGWWTTVPRVEHQRRQPSPPSRASTPAPSPAPHDVAEDEEVVGAESPPPPQQQQGRARPRQAASPDANSQCCNCEKTQKLTRAYGPVACPDCRSSYRHAIEKLLNGETKPCSDDTCSKGSALPSASYRKPRSKGIPKRPPARLPTRIAASALSNYCLLASNITRLSFSRVAANDPGCNAAPRMSHGSAKIRA
ncbi:unnamed protein product, partial [Mesorhabditis spiculigera]